jgi:hypothetical protein
MEPCMLPPPRSERSLLLLPPLLPLLPLLLLLSLSESDVTGFKQAAEVCIDKACFRGARCCRL